MVDTYTLGIIFIFSSFLYLLISISLWKLMPQEKSLIFFVLNSFLWIVGMLLILLRGKIPDFFSIVVSNALIVLGLCYLYIGIRKILKLNEGIRLEWAIFTLIFIHYYIFSAIIDNHTIRIIMFSIITIFYLASMGWLFWKHSNNHKLKNIYRVGSLVFFFGVFVFILRIFTADKLLLTPDSMKSANILHSLAILYAIFLNAWLSTVLGLIISSRLQDELKESYINRIYSMSEIINNIAHQWRQPLNRINSNIAVIKSCMQDEKIDKPLLEEKFSNIKKNTKYMSDTIEDFLNIFHKKKEKQPFFLKNTIENSVKMVEADNIEITYDLQYDKELYSFENEFMQVLMIILNNAIDNFQIRKIENPKIVIKLDSDAKHILLTICDNGGGITNDIIGSIFEPYFTTKFKHEGTGLGLYMAKILVEFRLDGMLSAKNIQNGVCFEISISKEENKHV
jgi:signal transduction histidine kinase